MRIGIDISQVVYEGTGVSRYVKELVGHIIAFAPEHEYVLFGASLRQQQKLRFFASSIQTQNNHVRLVVVPIPPKVLDMLWNVFHILPVQLFLGKIDVFWSSDWTQPPLQGTKGLTTIHDVSYLRYPESFPRIIRQVQKQRLLRVKQEHVTCLCDSEATKKDVIEFLHIPEEKCIVVYPGVRGVT